MKTIPKQIIWDGNFSLKENNVSLNDIGQLKYDGSQYNLHIVNHRAFALTSKRESVKTGFLNDKFENIPQLAKIKFPFKNYTVLATEVNAEHLKDKFDSKKILDKDGLPIPWSKRCNFVSGIMNSNVDTVLEKYPQGPPLKLVNLDIIFLDGEDMTDEAYSIRHKILTKYFDSAGKYGQYVKKDLIYTVDNFSLYKGYKKVFKDIVRMGYEGMVITNDDNNRLKLKKEKDADCVIMDFTKGKGKYSKMIGAVIVGVYKNGKLVDVGKVSGMTDELRENLTKNKKKYLGKVVDVKYMEWTGNKMRSPRWGDKGIRLDKAPKKCLINQF